MALRLKTTLLLENGMAVMLRKEKTVWLFLIRTITPFTINDF